MKKGILIAALATLAAAISSANAGTGVGAKPVDGAEVIIDGSRAMLDQKWIYWEGPGFKSSMPINWKAVEDPVDKGGAIQTDDRAADGGKFGAVDIVTKKTYRDFRLHIEFLIMKPGGNSGVYLQNRYEIQVLDGDTTSHGMAAVINETASPYYAYNGLGKWNAYDIVFRAARFKDGVRTEKAMLSMCFNGQKVYVNQTINQVWGGANSGIDGGNDSGKGITDTPGGLKLQAEGHNVLYRNIWIQELYLPQAETDLLALQVPLWPNGAPGFESRRNEPEQAKDWWVKNIHNPSITAYLPAKNLATGAAVLICPGGGHRATAHWCTTPKAAMPHVTSTASAWRLLC